MDAHALQGMLDLMVRTGFGVVPDPGASGTIVIEKKGDAICEVITAAAESRVLESADNFGIGQRLTVMLVTAGGALTVTGADDGSVVMSAAKDMAVFEVGSSISGTTRTKVWKVLFAPSMLASERNMDTVTKSSLTDTATVTAAQTLTKWIEGTPTLQADYTLPTAALLVAGLSGAKVGDAFILTVDNIAANAANTSLYIRLIAGSGGTFLGDPLVMAQSVRSFRIMLTNVTASSEAYTITAVTKLRTVSNQSTLASTNTLTAAQILGGMIDVTGTTGTYTFPTAANMIAGIPNCKVGDTFDFLFNNDGSGNATLAAGGATLQGATAALTVATTVCKILRGIVTNATVSSEAYTVYVP